jgi:Holliday junction DNA helicase RuvA
MYASIEGKIANLDATVVILETHGIGYEIKISLSTYSLLKEKNTAKLYTHVVLSDQTHTFSIYGFAEQMEKKVFLDLISVSGIGANTALTILSSLNITELQNAIIKEDLRSIQAIKGIGPKTAQRVILELKDKFKKESLISQTSVGNAVSAVNNVRSDALAALLALGIPKPNAEKTIDSILKNSEKSYSTEELIKIALKSS